MKKVFLLATLAISGLLSANAQVKNIVGEWRTVDDNTGAELSIVDIYQADNGKYYGEIVRLLVPGEEDAVCIACEGEDKNKPVAGLVIIRDMVEKDGALTGGKVLDPDNGKFYYGKISYENGKLKLRGSLDKRGFLGRTQYWIRK